MFTICWTITSTTLHCIFILCIQNRLLRFGLPSHNRHMSCATKSFVEKMLGLKTSAGCLASGVPCGWSSSWLGLHLSSSFSSRPSHSCGTCGGRTYPVHCGMVMIGKQEGLKPWESVVGALPSFLGVALEEPPQLLSPLPLLGLPSETPADFREACLRHTFLWLCKAKEDTKACFRHFPHP